MQNLKQKIYASYQVVAKEEKPKVNFKSEELAVLFGLIDSGFGTYDYMMSDEADEEWKYQHEENDKHNRKEWAREEDDFNNDMGNPAHYFSNVQRKINQWLIHFTNADPMKIVKEGFKGKDPYNIALTSNFKEGANPGSLAFAYPVNNVRSFEKYGENAVLTFVPECLIAFHIGDEEKQAVFDVKAAKKRWAIYGQDDQLTLVDHNKKEIATCDLNDECVEDLVKKIKGK